MLRTLGGVIARLVNGLGIFLVGVCEASAQIGDQRVCANETVLVEARDDYESYSFTPSTGVLWEVLWRARLNPAVTTRYRLRARRRLPTELIANPDFTSGTDGYASDLQLGGGGFSTGQAVTVARAGTLPGDHDDCADPSGVPGDEMLAFRLSAGQRARVACQTLAVEAGAEYRFESRVAALENRVRVGFAWVVNETQLGPTVLTDPASCTWRGFGRDYLATATANVEVCVVGEAPAASAVSGGLDEVSFRRYDVDHEEEFTVVVLPAPMVRDTTVAICPGGRFVDEALGLDLGPGEIGQAAIPLGTGCDSLVNFHVEATGEGGFVDSMAIGPLCIGAAVDVGGELRTAFTDTTFRKAFRTRGGCDSTVVRTVDVFDGGDVDFTVWAPSCGLDNGLVVVRPPASAVFAWDDGETGLTRQELSGGQALRATLTNASGCKAPLSIPIPEALPPPSVDILVPATCPGDAADVAITLSEGYTGAVEQGGVSILGFGESTTTQLEPGAYRIAWRGPEGCTGSAELDIESPPPPTLQLEGDTIRRLGGELAFRVVGPTPTTTGIPLRWRFRGADIDAGLLRGDALTAWRPTAGGDLTVNYTDERGCAQTLRRHITVERARDLAFASAFSPNEDGVNDALTLVPHEGISMLTRLEVFDRWGGHVYETGGILPGGLVWRGMAPDGRAVLSGAYVIVAEVLLTDGTTEAFTTTAEVIR